LKKFTLKKEFKLWYSMLSVLYVALVIFPHEVHAKLDERALNDLKGVEPSTRLEQVCDDAVMDKITNDKSNTFHPDRAVGEAEKPYEISGNTIEVKGGAFRSGDNWYNLEYTCTASADHLKVLSIRYKAGSLIPHSLWDKYYLWR